MTPYPQDMDPQDMAEPLVDVVVESPLWQAMPDCEAVIRRAVALAADPEVGSHCHHAEIAVLLCDDAAMAELNGHWRGQNRATNVLSFPAVPAFGDAAAQTSLGDIAIAYETVAREAAEQGKTVADHLAHLVVHGFLHLLGYDHDQDGEAERMERLERDILARIGIADPYASRDAGT
jgi:probable rRNA maturation factor